jgi:hypothetical protein
VHEQRTGAERVPYKWPLAAGTAAGEQHVSCKGDRKMKKMYALMVCMAVCGAALFAQTKSGLQEMYMDYLRQEGYAPSVDSDGDVAFKSDGRTYYIIVDEGDPVYFKILFPNFWKIESEAERAKASTVIMTVNRVVKVIKVYIGSNDSASIIADIYLNTPESFNNRFPRMLSAIQTARQRFIDGMNG